MKKPILLAAALMATSMAVSPAFAAPVFTQDFNDAALRGSFDAHATSDRFGETDYYNTADAAGISFTGYTHIAVDSASGNGALHLNEAANGRTGGVAMLTSNLAANTAYDLSFLLSGDNEPGQAYDFIAAIAGSTFTTPGVVGASGTNPGTTYSYRFTTGAAGAYTLTLSQSVANGGTGSPIVDDINISAVPEPATWGMMILGFGMIGFGLRARRRQSARVTYA